MNLYICHLLIFGLILGANGNRRRHQRSSYSSQFPQNFAPQIDKSTCQLQLECSGEAGGMGSRVRLPVRDARGPIGPPGELGLPGPRGPPVIDKFKIRSNDMTKSIHRSSRQRRWPSTISQAFLHVALSGCSLEPSSDIQLINIDNIQSCEPNQLSPNVGVIIDWESAEGLRWEDIWSSLERRPQASSKEVKPFVEPIERDDSGDKEAKRKSDLDMNMKDMNEDSASVRYLQRKEVSTASEKDNNSAYNSVKTRSVWYISGLCIILRSVL